MLKASNLTVALSGRPVLRGVTVHAAAGEVTGLIGPNGAGKTTLMRAAAGLAAASGELLIGGRPSASLSHGERARLAAYLPQARAVAWPVSVADLVMLGRLPWRRFGAKPADADLEACRNAMQRMDVVQLAARRVTELSGGEQARVLAARAIAQATPLLLADEPASGLDPAHQISMMAALGALAADGAAVLVSLHDLTLAARWCDRLVVLDQGGVAASGSPRDVLTSALLERVFGVTAEIREDDKRMVLAITGLAREHAA